MKRTRALKVVIICLCIVALCVGVAYAKHCKAVYMVNYVNGTPQIPVAEGEDVPDYSVYKENVTGNGRVKIWLRFDNNDDCDKREEMKKHMQFVKDIENVKDIEDSDQDSDKILKP